MLPHDRARKLTFSRTRSRIPLSAAQFYPKTSLLRSPTTVNPCQSLPFIFLAPLR